MTSRESILDAVRRNQPKGSPLPDISGFYYQYDDPVSKYEEVFNGIGGYAFRVGNNQDVISNINIQFPSGGRFVTTLNGLEEIAASVDLTSTPHSLDDVELAIVGARLAVAENGAVWLSEEDMGHRVLPYICQHLAVIIPASAVVSTMHEAYEFIGKGDYGFGGFIGGPSKTADIEQALVLGAHGPLSMTVYLMDPQYQHTKSS